ncbi:MAG: cysteine-rich secretory family protein [Ramlibacter sp.]|nr:cysteine-rich secretory family protein [Ramlibacter sp.]
MRDAILQQINLARASGHVCGTEILPPVPALAWNDVLFSAAARHSQDMATRNYFSHTTPEGISFSQRLSTEGYSAWAEGENIAAGQGSVSEVMSAWLGSEGHCRNIMQSLFTEVAVACVMQPASSYGNYWSMELGGR